jgi:hypothetical protein
MLMDLITTVSAVLAIGSLAMALVAVTVMLALKYQQ